MKRIFFLLIAANGALSAIAQAPDANSQSDTAKHHRRYYKPDNQLGRWVIDLNALGGPMTQSLTTANTYGNYTNGISGNNTGNLTFKNGMSYGGDAQIGYFFGSKAHWGIGTGIMYLNQTGDADLDAFHVQYQSTDNAGNTFRQVITADNPITEKITVTNINIPLLLKYKIRFSKRFGFTADAGLLFNVQMKNAYNTNASFDYEAIYQFTNPPNGLPTLYDNGATPNVNDYLITKSNYLAHTDNPNGLNAYFQSQNAKGYNVGLGMMPSSNNKGNVSYATGTVGFMFQPSINYFLSDWCALNIGGYFIFQPFNNTVQQGYRLTDKVGGYSSVLNSVSSGTSETYGGNLGVRFFFGRKQAPPVITFTDESAPSGCGICDGSITLYGLPAGRNVSVSYDVNGNTHSMYSGMVANDGTVKINNLCAGYYSNIAARVGKGTAMGSTVLLTDPVIKITSVTSTNPTANGKCDGTIVLHGLNSGSTDSVNYYMDGGMQPAFGAAVAKDNTLTIPALCGGKYTGIVVSANNCKANAPTDATLVTPPPPPPPPSPAVKRESEIDPSTPILFDFAKSTIHESSYDILEEAVLELNDNKDAYLVIDGHTDDIGSASANKVLSYKRAQAVKDYLKEMGINEKRLITVGHGDEAPIAPNSTEEGRAKNRRAIMTIKHSKD